MPKFITALVTYLKASVEELRKVAWPSRAETVRYSLLVIGITVGLAAAIGLLDFGLTIGVEKIVTLISK